jgi:ribonuclease HI
MEQKWKASDPTASTEHQDMTAINGDFELNELIAAIKSTKVHSAPGEDNLTYELIKHLPKSALKKLLLFFNNLWKNQKIIPEWKTAIVLPIYKPGKDKHSPESYRPISLTSALCKINEKLITTRLIWFLETNNIINPAQSAYRKNRSTLDHLIRLTDNINKTINNKRHTVGIFFDFSHAFDMIWKQGLLHKLDRIGISGRIKSWIADFLENRKIKVKINNTISKEFRLDNGTPQGSVISPILFLIMINDFPSSTTSDIQTSIFADDSAIWKSGANLNHIISELKPQVNKIAEWCEEWGFTLNEKKTTAVIFTKSNQIRNNNVPIVINGMTIATAKSIKFLGLTIDQQLTWTEHINSTISKAKSKINLLRSISGSRWGANKTTLLRIYKTIIRPKLEYGLEAMTSITKSARQKIEKIQNCCLRICTGAMKSTALDVLQQECGELPLRLRQQENLLKYSARIQNSTNNPATSIHQDSWENHYGKFTAGTEPIFTQIENFRKTVGNQVATTEFRKSAPWRRSLVSTDTTIVNLIKNIDNIDMIKSAALESMEKYRNHLQIYTDAAKTETGRTGCAFYNKSDKTEQQLRLPSICAIETAESIAIQQALHHITDCNLHDIKLAIFTDSLQTIDSIEKAATSIYSSTHTEIINQIQDLQEKSNITTEIIWIPSHVGIQANEKADRLAKMAAAQETPPEDRIPNKTDRKQQIIDYINSQWQAIYNDKPTGRHYKTIEPTVSRKIKYSDNNRHKETTITRFRLGKCCLNAYLHEIHCHPTGLCEHCQVPETIQHFLIDCKNSPTLRNHNISIQEALSDDSNIELIYQHIKTTGRKL